MAQERRSFGNTTKIGSLLERIEAGDQSAREELLLVAKERLGRMASKMLSSFPQLREQGRAETGMVLNDTLMSLYKSFDDVKFESPRHFINLAATKIRRCLIDLKRKHQREIEEMGDQLATAGGNVQESDSLSIEDWAAFHEAVEKLPSEEKEVFSLRYYGGWSREEAATIIGVAEKTVTRRYGRATQTLAKMLE
jgi:RNA polymerase sigma-70 factor (ECF subfamily)